VDVVTTWAPLLGGLLGAGVGIGVLIAVAAWHGELDRPMREKRRPSIDRFELRIVLALSRPATPPRLIDLDDTHLPGRAS
jgi:hypothetical protein